MPSSDRQRRSRGPIENPFNLPQGAHAAWQSHLDAGRLAPPTPAAPETVARREATARLFERIAKGAAR